MKSQFVRRAATRLALLVCVIGALVSHDESVGAASNYALQCDGVNDYVTFDNPPALGLSAFTLELWFRRDGAGVATSTGTGGVSAVPLVSKGRAEVDGSNRDM